jgi:hypothetical protein
VAKSPLLELLTREDRHEWQQGYKLGYKEGYEEGCQEGVDEGIRMIISRQLGRKQIPLDAPADEHIRSLPRDTLLSLGCALLDFQTRADLDAWLAQATAQE